MEELIARLEAAEGADRELDVEIWRAVGSSTELRFRPEYTASIDAALTLVPEECLWRIGHEGDDSPGHFLAVAMPLGPQVHATAITPALALCMAALKARAQTASTA